MKIIFTGGGGRFGQVFKRKTNLKNISFPTRRELDILNINQIKKYLSKKRPAVLIHAAGLSRPMNIHETDIEKSIDLNIIGTANLVKICKKFNIKIIYFSTSYVYEGLNGNHKESDPVKPFNNYGISKLGGECSVLMYKNSLILRITMTEKPFMFKKAYSNLIANYMYHEDLVKILPKILNKKGILNIGGKTQSIYAFARSKNLEVKKVRLKKTDKLPLNQGMSLNKLKKIIKLSW